MFCKLFFRQLGSEIRGIRGLLTPMFQNINGEELLADPVDNNSISNNNIEKSRSRRHSMSKIVAQDLEKVMVDPQWTENDSVNTWISVDYDPYDTDFIENSDDNDNNSINSNENSDIKCDL